MSDVIEAEDSRDPTIRSPPGTEKVPGDQTARMARFYRHQAALFDLTRRPILLGRDRWDRLLTPGERVVEIGCGTGRNLAAIARAVAPGGHVVGVECAPSMVRRARRRTAVNIEVVAAEYRRDHGLAALGGADAFVFSYSLSMMPQFAAILDQVRTDLSPGGRLIVVDFAASRVGLLRRWMARCHVALGTTRIAAIRERFDAVTVEMRQAHGALWQYYRLVAHKPAAAPST